MDSARGLYPEDVTNSHICLLLFDPGDNVNLAG